MSFREIVETDGFQKDKERVATDAKRLDEMLLGVTWAMSQHPEHFPLVPGTKRLHMAATDPFPDAPPARVWFTFDDEQIELLGLEFAEDGPEG